MPPSEDQLASLTWLRDQFTAGRIAPEDLLLHLEPALVAAPLQMPEGVIRLLVNRVERITHTESEPRRSVLLAEVLEESVRRASGL